MSMDLKHPTERKPAILRPIYSPLYTVSFLITVKNFLQFEVSSDRALFVYSINRTFLVKLCF